MLPNEDDVISFWTEGNCNKPIVSIRCITYNHEKYIDRALEGFLRQKTKYSFEIIIHDDASSDSTEQIIRKYVEKYPNIIKPIYEKENQYSKGVRFNEIIDPYIKGQYVMLCEGDDYWISDNKIQSQIDYMKSHVECSMCYHPVYYYKDKYVMNDVHYNEEHIVDINDIIKGGGGFCATCSICVKTDIWKSYPSFRKHAKVGDYPIQVYSGLKGKVFCFPEIMGVYRMNSDNSWTKIIQKDKTMMINNYRNEIEWLMLFDKFSNYVYSDSVAIKCCENYCELLKNNKKYDLLFSESLHRIRDISIKKGLVKRYFRLRIKMIILANETLTEFMIQKGLMKSKELY